MEEKRFCESCKFFVQHFVKHSRSLPAVNYFNFNNHKLTLAKKRKRQRKGECELWELKEPEKDQPSLEKALVDIAEHLSVIAEQLSVIATVPKKDQP